MSGQVQVPEDERLWGFIAWVIPLVGGILALVLKPGIKYIRHWSYLSITFGIIMIVGLIIGRLFSIIPLVGWLVELLIGIALLIMWVVGIVRALDKILWKPPIVYDLAKTLGFQVE
ncbi:MAG: hypothetical protein QXV06_05440 [Ignisphaera sp.]